MRGLERKTLDPYRAGWRRRVVPSLGHLPVRMVTNGAVDRAVHGWISEECSRSTVKNSIAILVRVMEQAVRDGIIDRNPAKVTGWQRQYRIAEDELDDPRSLALPGWTELVDLAAALVARSHGQFAGWGDVVIVRRRDRGPHRRGVRGPGRRHRRDHVAMDGAPPDHPWRRAASSTKARRAGAPGRCR